MKTLMAVKVNGSEAVDGMLMKVDESKVLKLDVKVALVKDEWIVEVIHVPKTIPLKLKVGEIFEDEYVLRWNGRIFHASPTLEIKHHWFIDKFMRPLLIIAEGGEEVYLRRMRWKRLGRLGWLKTYETYEKLSPSSRLINLIYGGLK